METEAKDEEENSKTSVNQSKTPFENDSDLEKSDNDLEIDLNRTLKPRKAHNQEKFDEGVIDTIEQEIGKQLTEKAEKNNLTISNVKTIIRQVLTNEHVKALLEKGDLSDSKSMLSAYEPKLTRAKAKALISSNIPVSSVNIPWVPQPPPSETHVLIGEDLKEEDSGDEYVPGEEESEDDRDESIASESDISSLPPPTPPTVCMEDHATQTTNYTDDGVFKIPPPKTTLEETVDEAANIALRTRSKINLSSTPLEVIEKSFVPPDITTDMYDMECDDDEWRDFLKGFTEPLEEVTKPTEDEEHDPEYNIMADDEINQVDNEDFRVDRAVKISKKEVKELWEELFDYLHNISEEHEDQNNKTQNILNNTAEEELSCTNVAQDQNESQISEISQLDVSVEECDSGTDERMKDGFEGTATKKKNSDFLDITIGHQQISIIEQQMRQHVQMLTQNFLLTYEHPEFHEYSLKFQEYLLNLKYISDGKTLSLFRSINLLPALELVNSWVDLFASNNAEVLKTKAHVQQELTKSLHYKMAGNWRYVLTFPRLFLETVSKSEVFLYPSLLPKIPFKSEEFSGSRCGFTDAEDRLLVFGLDMFKKYLLDQKIGRAILKQSVSYIQEHMMPHRSNAIILKHIYQSQHPRCATNPIQQYILHGKIKPFVHYIYTLNPILPPCKRLPQELPEQWKNFVYPSSQENVTLQQMIVNSQVTVPRQVIVINSPFLGCLINSPIILTGANKGRKTKADTNNGKLRNSLAGKFNASQNINKLTKTNSEISDSEQEITRNYLRLNRRVSSKENNRILRIEERTIERFIFIFLQPIAVQKLVKFLIDINVNHNRKNSLNRDFVKLKHYQSSTMLPNMPNLTTPMKNNGNNDEQRSIQDDTDVSSTTVDSIEKDEVSTEITSNLPPIHKKPEMVTSSTVNQETKKDKSTKNLEFSTITSSSFQHANNSSEVEFCRNSSNIQICQTSQSDDHEKPSSSGYITSKNAAERDNPEDINALFIASSKVKPNVRKELSGAEKKKNKLRKDFLANLSIATPEDSESEKHKNEMFAIAYYDKLRETLELEDYHKIMQILNDFESGDIIDLYKNIQPILHPKYAELAEEFLYFLREKEAAAVGQLIPWLEVQTRSKFLRKLEIYFKDQPAQLRKIYNCLMKLTQSENLNMEKIKNCLLPMLKGNTILIDLFLQNFRDERPPSSLLDGPYETIDINKELARPDNEERYETFIVPNTEDKYGGPNCICHCHKIEDNEYKSRYKHCKSCGLKFANGKPLLQSGRSLKPATVTFELNPNANHNARLLGKSAAATSTHKKKRSDTSPNKQVNSSGKENLDDDTEDEEIGKRKRSVSQKSPRKRKKTDQSRYQDNNKPSSPKKSPARSGDSTDIQKDSIKPRKRTYSGKRSKKEETKKTGHETETDKIEETEAADEKGVDEDVEIIAEIDESCNETSEEQQEKSMADDCMDSSGESIEKPLTPGQQTAESESDIYLEESSQDNYESDDSSSSTESAKGSQSDNNTNDEPAWKREEDTIILETLQKEDDKEYALQVISDKLLNRTISQIRSRLSRLMDLLIETLKNT